MSFSFFSFLKICLFEINEHCSQLFADPFCLPPLFPLHSVLFFFHDRYFRGMTIFLLPPTHQRSLHPPHTNADDQILMKSDFSMDFQSLSSRDSTVWRGCDSKMYAKIKKVTFGFRNRTDLFKRLMGLSQSPWSTWSFS